MWSVEENFHVILGGNTYIDTPNLIAYRGAPLFTIKRSDSDGVLGIDFDIFNVSGGHITAIKRNEIYLGDKDAYEITLTMNHYIVKEKSSGRVLCDIKRREEAHPAELEVSVTLYTPDGFLLEATPVGTNLPGMYITGCTFKNNNTGIDIQ